MEIAECGITKEPCDSPNCEASDKQLIRNLLIRIQKQDEEILNLKMRFERYAWHNKECAFLKKGANGYSLSLQCDCGFHTKNPTSIHG